MEVAEDVGITMEETTKDGYQRIQDRSPERKSDMPGLPDFMLDERIRIQEMYRKNKKQLDKWINLDNSFKQIQRVVVAFTMISAAVVGVVAGVLVDPILSFIAAGLAGFGALKEPLAKMFITDFTTKKRINYMDKCRVIKDCLDGMYMSYIQANQDGEISVKEVRKYQTLIQGMETKLFDIESDLMVV